jgi:hypothetical protein
MPPLLNNLHNFMPHGMCFLWEPTLLWLHVLSDTLIALSYFSIPLALWYFTKIGGKLPFKQIIFLFCAFIFACGFTHVLSIWTVWVPDYYMEGLVKFLTAGLSIVTAIALWPLVVKASTIPDLLTLQETNQLMEQDIQNRKAIEEDLRSQTSHLEEANKKLLRVNNHLSNQELRMLELKKEINSLAQKMNHPLPYPAID